ncbi:MAG TPA: hypothetical protein VF521_03510 [Pyrinomonadaceae bacterium]|jgi:hypothetical protein
MRERDAHTRPALVFVYNAKSGVFNALADAAHKIFSPQTYACNLCALTHTAVGMRKEWKQFLEKLDSPLEFLHADELEERYGLAGVPLPAVFRREGGDLKVLVGADAINACETLDDLKGLLLNATTAARP